MRKSVLMGSLAAGAAAGCVAGLFGAGGGMVLVPALTLLTELEEDAIFPTSLSIMLPICTVSVIVTAVSGCFPWKQSLPYLLGSGVGGIAAGLWGKRIPTRWLHFGLGVLIIWGGIRYLCWNP